MSRHWSADAKDVGIEGLTSAFTVFVVAASSLLSAGDGTLVRALLGSLSLGLGIALVLWTAGRAGKPQWSPLLSLLMLATRHHSWKRTFAAIASQLLGVAVARAALGTLGIRSSEARTSGFLVAEAGSAFAFALLSLAVAYRRDHRVLITIGTFAVASFWTTGVPTMGNPLLTLAFAGRGLALFAALGAELTGFVLGALLGWWLFPQAAGSASAMLYTPRGRS